MDWQMEGRTYGWVGGWTDGRMEGGKERPCMSHV